ncbi:hypothetical protein CYMTET_26921 [Cymbomonas tetramitiformis]|uniref:Uncharacterized protein n=1 Tax=Cymbomonas tetramitiformis TaxID=36881 RepID=A0AAE0FRB2_9CHLO|nr:hypothetical protein CYMTET_26921 [Cymbomonas tetramitiformis]
MVCRGSHRSRAFGPLRASYGASEVGQDGTRSGWLSSDGSSIQHAVGKYAVDWRTTDYAAGDLVVLGLNTLHMSAQNCTDHIRTSCDTRWQLGSERTDPRLKVWCSADGPVFRES